MFTALYENNDDEENKIQFDEYLETAINFSKNREKELLDEFTEGIIFDGDSYKEWYELYCEQIEKIYVEEFMWLVQKSEDDKENNPDPVPYSIDSPYPADKYPHKYYRNYKNNPNPFVSAFYKLKKVYQFTKTHGRPSLYEIFNSED